MGCNEQGTFMQDIWTSVAAWQEVVVVPIACQDVRWFLEVLNTGAILQSCIEYMSCARL